LVRAASNADKDYSAASVSCECSFSYLDNGLAVLRRLDKTFANNNVPMSRLTHQKPCEDVPQHQLHPFFACEHVIFCFAPPYNVPWCSFASKSNLPNL
jgi:hypothetical protein